MMLGTAKGDFSLPGMEARCDKPQQGTTCTTLAPGLWHGHMQRAAAAGLSDFFAPPISLKTKISKKVFANQDFYLTIPYGVLYLPCRKVRPELVGAEEEDRAVDHHGALGGALDRRRPDLERDGQRANVPEDLVPDELTVESYAAAGITRSRFGKGDSSLCANGWVAGLVAASAGCAMMRPAAAVLVGIVGGALAIYGIEWLDLHLSLDDTSGAIPVHAGAGLWGLMAAALLSAEPVAGQWLAQLVGIATLVGFVLPLTFGLNWLLDRFYGLRVTPEAERQGLDLYELGAGAYPDFLSHTDDTWLR